MSDVIFNPPRPNLLGGEKQEFKDTKDKPRTDMIPADCILSLGKVFSYGRKKYEDIPEEKWDEVPLKEYRGALLRHYAAWLDDKFGLDESGLYHFEHLLWNAMAINHIMFKRIRSKTENKIKECEDKLR